MSNSIFQPATLWFIVGILLLCMELLTPGFLVFFFGVGGIVTGLACWLFDISFSQQLLIFMISSIALLVGLRRFLHPIAMGTSTSSPDAAEFAGKQGVVRVAISPPLPGKIELHGTTWTAVAESPIPAGRTVRVLRRENMTLHVVEI